MAEQVKAETKVKKVEKEVELTEEDKKLQDDLNLLVQRLSESDASLYSQALETMRSLIRASTTSMTSVPKPLKFMRPHYPKMKQIYEEIADETTKKSCADVISILAMCADESTDCIKYRLLGSREPIGEWGHEYVRHLSLEMTNEWRQLYENKELSDGLIGLVREIIIHNMKHNAEVEACDLLIEIEQLPLLLEYVEEDSHSRVCIYLLSCVPLTSTPENSTLINSAKDIYLKFNKYFDALRCAIMLNDMDVIRSIFLDCTDTLLQKQMAILLGRHQIFLELEDEKLAELNSNTNLYSYFHSLARELDIMEPKTPESVYKTHLEQTRPFANQIGDSVRLNLASSFVNGFVNCGFGVDKILSETDEANRWFAKNREYATLSAAASQGLIHRWDVDNGLTVCDRFLYSNDDYVRAGTLLAIGITSSGIQDPVDPACAILMDHITSDRIPMRIGSILGLGLAYANSKRATVVKNEDGGVIYELRKIFSDTKPSANAEVKGLAALALGFILVGTADHLIAADLLNYLMETNIEDSNNRFVALGIALIFLGTQ